ncbi:MAG: DUF4912 domain-containing protein [Bacillota bacterium]|nr:DUF4912 domain-containing protein [Bacillota bacterium]
MAVIDFLVLFFAILVAGGLALMSKKGLPQQKPQGSKQNRCPTRRDPFPIEAAEEFTATQPQPLTGKEEREAPRPETYEFPWAYGESKIVALVRDPYWIFVYWEINDAKRREVEQRFGPRAWEESRPVLRVYDTTNLYFFDSRDYVEIAINDYANNWYIHTGEPNKTFCVELGRVRPDGTYIFIARSNFVSTPRDRVSEIIDEEWLLLAEYEKKLYERIGRVYPGPSSPSLIGSPMKW